MWELKKKMGKSLKKQESKITLNQTRPGCMWGLFHHLQQNRWHKVVKKLPRAPFVHAKNSSSPDEEMVKASSNDEKIEQEEPHNPSLNVEAKHPNPSPNSHPNPNPHHNPGHKHSMKKRLKAFTEEVYKRKGRHRRSTSYPVRKPPDEHLLSHEKAESLDNVLPPKAAEGSSNAALPVSSPRTMRLNYLKQIEVDGSEPVRDHTLLHGNLIYAIEPSRGDSLHESKLFMNALNLLDVREEMFMQILKDPSVSMANQLHCRRSPNLRYGLNKSMSFSASAPFHSRDFDVASCAKKQENRDVKEKEKEKEKTEEKAQKSEASEASEIVAPVLLRKKSDERVGLMHFKNIREKIKYVIRDRKKEKNRIMMDALHHKVPYGASPSKKLADDAGQAGSGFAKSPTRDYKRTASFDNSLDRYNKLIDIGSRKDGKGHTSKDGITRKPPMLGRILSLPDIRSHIDVGSPNEGKVSEHVDKEQVQEDNKSCFDLGSTNEGKVSDHVDKEQVQEDKSCFDLGSTNEEKVSDHVDKEHVQEDNKSCFDVGSTNEGKLSDHVDKEHVQEDNMSCFDVGSTNEEKVLDHVDKEQIQEDSNSCFDLESTNERKVSDHVDKEEEEVQEDNSCFNVGSTNEGKTLDRVEVEEAHVDEVDTSSVLEKEDQEIKFQEEVMDVGESLDASGDSKAHESSSSRDLRDESQMSADPVPSKADVQELEASAVLDESRLSTTPQKEAQESEENLDSLDLSEEDMIDIDIEECDQLGLYESCVSPQDAVGIIEENQIQQFYNDLLHVQGEEGKNNAEFNYVKGVLELSGFSKNESLGEWHSAENPLNPLVFEEVGGCPNVSHDYYGNQEDGMSNQLLLFDLINEVLLLIHERSFCYWRTPLTSRSSIHPLPKGSRVLEEVWAEIRVLLSSTPEPDDDPVSRDLAKNDGWMNLQLDAECIGLELEDLILDDLVEEMFED